MFYTLKLTAEQDSNWPAEIHHPVTIETVTCSKEKVTDEEIDMVADAFKAQVKQILLSMVRLDAS